MTINPTPNDDEDNGDRPIKRAPRVTPFSRDLASVRPFLNLEAKLSLMNPLLEVRGGGRGGGGEEM
jgi:hypothetical protein